MHGRVASSFRHTIRSLERGRRRPWLVAGGAFALLAAWLIWFVVARVPIYESSLGGRIESSAEARPIEVPVAGTVVAFHLSVGQRVAPGDKLIELDSEPLRLERTALEQKLAALEAEQRTLEEGRTFAQALVASLEKEGDLAVKEAKSSLRGSRVSSAQARRERRRAAKLHKEGLTSSSELEQAQAKAAQSGADAAALGVHVSRVAASGQLKLEEQRLSLSRLERELAVVAGAIAAARSAMTQLDHEIERRVIRAPVAGLIGSLGTARVGSYLAEGDDVAVLVPDGTLLVVSSFAASSSGRLQAGQTVVLRFPAYPWTAYGSRRGRVARVASEAQDQRLRVDIEIDEDAGSRIPVEHGQEVVAEVLTESVSPAVLLLRNAGVLLGGSS